jgi:hypothetical protein
MVVDLQLGMALELEFLRQLLAMAELQEEQSFKAFKASQWGWKGTKRGWKGAQQGWKGAKRDCKGFAFFVY